MTDHTALSARELAARVRARQVSVREVTQAALDRVAARNPVLNAIVQDCADEAMEAAHALDRRIAEGAEPGLLAGVPVTTKVIADQAGHATTNGTHAGLKAIATQDSPFLTNMRRQGAIVIGRTNAPAFSYRWFTSNAVHGTTLNPHNADLTPGGSSGGAGSAVAAGMGHVAHGTDIAGSIRYPAYACGVQGLRPTPGRVPAFNATSGDRAIGPQLMAVSGPLARRVDDLRLALAAMSGPAPDDPASAPVPLDGPPVRRRAALIPRPGGIDTDPRILDDLDRAAAHLRAAGWEVDTPAETPDLREAVELQIDLWLSDDHAAKMKAAEADGDAGALACLTRFTDRAAKLDMARFSQIFIRRAALIRAWRGFLADYPLVLMPNSAELPFLRDEDLNGPEALDRIWAAQLPQIATPLLGLPGLSVASGVEGGVPSGVQLVATHWREDVLLRAGEVIETGFGFPQMPD